MATLNSPLAYNGKKGNFSDLYCCLIVDILKFYRNVFFFLFSVVALADIKLL